MRKPTIIAVTALAAASLLGGAMAYASIPGPDGVVHGCYKTATPNKGTLLAVDSAASCPSGYTALDWNQTGPAGPPGPAYTPPVGTRGTGQVSGLMSPGQEITLRGLCFSNEIALGGGYQNRDPQNLTVVLAHDLFQQSSLLEPHGYEVVVVAGPNGSQDPIGVRVEATCGGF